MCKNNLWKQSSQGLIGLIVLLTLAFSPVINATESTTISPYTPHWVFFVQKNSSEGFQLAEKVINRRLTRSNSGEGSWYDIPVDQNKIDRVRATGAKIRIVSRWLNAISVNADNAQIAQIRNLPFVSRIAPVSGYKSSEPSISSPIEQFRPGKRAALNYGQSYAQVAMLAIDSLHNAGLSGRGVLIGVIDTGFDTSHVAFRQLAAEHRILATYDFINGDSNVMDLWDVQRFHGTAVLSALGGHDEGNLIGPAYGANFVLAKTEIDSIEIRAEEDYWVAAAEWMESLGVEIISSSVGYIDWYDTTQLDGHTAVITQAANIANSLGVVVVNAAGNEGSTSWHKIFPPADGDSVIAVGAVDLTGTITSFSSRGPTADGRIKPDVCALGQQDYVANYAGGYALLSGTSFAAPLIAGGIALLLEGHPDWTIADIIGNLKESSSKASSPNNRYGWGIPDFALAYHMEQSSGEPKPAIIIAPHPAIDSVVFNLTIPQAGSAILSVHDLSGAEIQEWELSTDAPATLRQVWDGKNRGGDQVASGVYICILKVGNSIGRQKLFYISK
jgi:serine protease AprX